MSKPASNLLEENAYKILSRLYLSLNQAQEQKLQFFLQYEKNQEKIHEAYFSDFYKIAFTFHVPTLDERLEPLLKKQIKGSSLSQGGQKILCEQMYLHEQIILIESKIKNIQEEIFSLNKGSSQSIYEALDVEINTYFDDAMMDTLIAETKKTLSAKIPMMVLLHKTEKILAKKCNDFFLLKTQKGQLVFHMAKNGILFTLLKKQRAPLCSNPPFESVRAQIKAFIKEYEQGLRFRKKEAGHYQEKIDFLQNLKCTLISEIKTLDPLRTFLQKEEERIRALMKADRLGFFSRFIRKIRYYLDNIKYTPEKPKRCFFKQSQKVGQRQFDTLIKGLENVVNTDLIKKEKNQNIGF